MSGSRFTRRTVILGGAAVALTSSGALWLSSRADDASQWIEAVVRHHLTGIDLDDESLRRFAAELATTAEFSTRKVELALFLDAMSPTLVRVAPEVGAKIAQLERLVLTHYLLGSNFFRVESPDRERIYFGAASSVCGNPFAVFRND